MSQGKLAIVQPKRVLPESHVTGTKPHPLMQGQKSPNLSFAQGRNHSPSRAAGTTVAAGDGEKGTKLRRQGAARAMGEPC
jgi:hypothetical protein